MIEFIDTNLDKNIDRIRESASLIDDNNKFHQSELTSDFDGSISCKNNDSRVNQYR